MVRINDTSIKNQCILMDSQGYLLTEIANTLGISCFEVYNNIVNTKNRITTEEERALFIELREQGMSYRQISRLVGRSTHCVRSRINSPAKYIHPKTKYILSSEQLEILKSLYINGCTLSEIGRLLHLDPDAVRYRIIKCGLYKQSPLKVTEQEKLKFIELYNKGMAIKDIAKKCKRNRSTVSRYLKIYRNSESYKK